MSAKNVFINARKPVRESFGKSEKDVLKDVAIIRKWLKTQPHLPEVPSDNVIESFLAMNKFSIERTKQRLDMYYTIRSLMPEIYVHCHPQLPYMQDIAVNVSIVTPLPRQTKEFYRVYMAKIMGPYDNFDLYKCFAHSLNCIELKIEQDVTAGDVYVVDMKNITMNHLVKMTPLNLKKVATVLEKVYSNRIKGIYVLYGPPFMDILMRILKTVFKPKIFGRIRLNNSLEELYKYVPKEILPADYGGNELNLLELNDLWLAQLKEFSSRFNKLAKIKVDEKRRAAPLRNDEILGYHGNFKKLDVD